MSAPAPFEIPLAQRAWDDLRTRLRRTRWPDRETVDGWAQGVPTSYLKDLCAYWAEEYSWEDRRNALMRYPHVRVPVEEIRVHALHARSSGAEALPLLLIHGWPSTAAEFLDVLDNLTADFHVVCPSLPGHGWSDKPREAGWGIERIATALVSVMSALGYPRFAVMGGDWGAEIARAIAAAFPNQLIGMHLTFVSVPATPSGEHTPAEDRALARITRHRREDAGFAAIQATRPQTIGYGLTDSPVAQCGWIVERFCEWSDCGGDPVATLGADRILDAVTIYWLTATAASSARLYWESYGPRRWAPTSVPMGASIYPAEVFTPSQRWAEPYFLDIRHWSELPRGGHFPALEEPASFVDEARAFLRAIR